MALSIVRRSAVGMSLWIGAFAMTVRGDEPAVSFTNDIRPILTKYGCNSGGCHGKSVGQNGFRLSLLGYEPSDDHEAIAVEARGRRVFPAAPDESLLLRKAAGKAPHGGGRLVDPASEDFATLRRWIAQGCPPPRATDPVVVEVTVEPREAVLGKLARQPLRVEARFSDGTRRDVTRMALYESNEPNVASVDASGVVTTNAKGGLFAVMARYGDVFAVHHGTIPYRTPTPRSISESHARSNIDRLLRRQWDRLGIEPSPPADDATFIRRVSLDIRGSIPTEAETREYLADSSPDKKSRLIDRLLGTPEYAAYWALRWGDILRNRGGGYSVSRQRAGTTLFSDWLREAVETNMPYDEFARAILTATGSQETNPPTVWYRSIRTPRDYVESVSQTFLGVRVQCAQCHHHPAERWSQDDYYGLAAVFAQVGRKGGFADAEVPTSQTIFAAREGRIANPRTGKVMKPRPLGGPDFASISDDPREDFAEWLTASTNPFFARAMANRVWGHFMGRGLVHPIDDARAGNPPSNPELLDELTREFVKSGFNVKQLIRLCCNSESYGASAAPNETNRDDVQTFARYYPRRLPAEVLLDAVSRVLDVPTEFPGGPGKFPVGTKAIELPDESVPNQFLEVFGRPARSTSCECERVGEASLGQALAIIGSPEIERKLTAPKGYVARVAADPRPIEKVLDDVFLRVFVRTARSDEIEKARRFLDAQGDRRQGLQSLLWSLLATSEFIFNH